jgi:hypothetical protein
MVVSSTIRKPQHGHAYSLREIRSLRNILNRNETDWPDEQMYLHTDSLAVLVGWHARNEREIIPKYRIPEIQSRLSEPAKTLLTALKSGDFSKEFRVTWGGLREVDTDLLVGELEKILVGVPRHIKAIKEGGVKGKRWDSDLKDHFIRSVTYLCEFLNNDFRPSVRSLERPAFILATPLFHLDPKADRPLQNAIVKYVKAFLEGTGKQEG